MRRKANKRMSSKSSRRKSNMENGNHEETSATTTTTETNGATEELKGFTTSELTTSKAVIKDVSVVLTPVPELEKPTVGDDEPEKRVTRSKKKENGDEVGNGEPETTEKRMTRSQTKDDEEVEADAKEASDAEKELLEPDETEPELQFDENSDNSGKNSPASRCFTRRSHMRNLPTPKSPTVATPTPTPEADETKSDRHGNSADASSVTETSSEDLSTQAQPGNDTTRANFTANEEESQEPSEFFKSLKDRSYGETLRGLSSRRTISLRHPHIARSEFSVPYPKRASVESISGVKRKQRSPSPEENKRMKVEGGGLLSYIKSPVFGARHHFSKDLPSSTPKLTGFRNKNSLLDGEVLDKIKLEVEVEQPEKKWCSIM